MAEETPRATAMKRTNVKRFRFHENNMEPTDSEFNDLFDQYNGRSRWFVLMFILSCLPAFCVECERSSLLVSKNLEGMCIFPDLLNNNWTLTMTNNLTRPENGGRCSYHMFDFEEIKSMPFNEAMEMKNNMERLPPVGTCVMRIDPTTYRFINPNFLKTCASLEYKRNASYFKLIGEVLSCVIMGIIGDLYGRKFGIWLCFPVYVAALIMQPLSWHYYILCLENFCEGFGATGLLFLSYILITELCNPHSRGIFCIYVTSLGIIGRLCAFYIKRSTFNYALSSTMCAVPSLSLVLYLVYVPESPRWQLSYGMKRQAWATLNSIGANTSGNVYLPVITLSKGKTFYDNLQILFQTPKYRKSLFIISLAFCFEGAVYFQKAAYIRVDKLKITSHRLITITGDFFSFLNVLPPFIIFGRYWSIMGIYAISLLYMLITMVFNNVTTIFILNTLTAVTLSSMQFIVLLYFCELIPTCTRATAVGLSWVFAKAFVFILHFFIWLSKFEINYKNMNYVHFALGVCCVVSLMFLPNVHVHNLPDFKRGRNVAAV